MAKPGFAYMEAMMRNRFVRALVEPVRQITIAAGLRLSLAARARYLKDAVCEGQDWVEWRRDGLLDFVCPMSYNPWPERYKAFVAVPHYDRAFLRTIHGKLVPRARILFVEQRIIP